MCNMTYRMRLSRSRSYKIYSYYIHYKDRRLMGFPMYVKHEHWCHGVLWCSVWKPMPLCSQVHGIRVCIKINKTYKTIGFVWSTLCYPTNIKYPSIFWHTNLFRQNSTSYSNFQITPHQQHIHIHYIYIDLHKSTY